MVWTIIFHFVAYSGLHNIDRDSAGHSQQDVDINNREGALPRGMGHDLRHFKNASERFSEQTSTITLGEKDPTNLISHDDGCYLELGSDEMVNSERINVVVGYQRES